MKIIHRNNYYGIFNILFIYSVVTNYPTLNIYIKINSLFLGFSLINQYEEITHSFISTSGTRRVYVDNSGNDCNS